MNYIFLVMDLMTGGSLKDLITERYHNGDKFFSDEECSIIIKNILEGLCYLDSRKIVHNDIKPENIILRRKNDLNSITIGDFGLSTFLDNENAELNCGTLIYMSPETLKKHHNASCDSWACGFILYILCSGGRHPVYKQGMTFEGYSELLKNGTGWRFPDCFPLLARNLFLKMCKFDKYRRYEGQRALIHPWITRTNTPIPLTLMDTYSRKHLLGEFKTMLCAIHFMSLYRKERCVAKTYKTSISPAKTTTPSPQKLYNAISPQKLSPIKTKHNSMSIINLNDTSEEKSKSDQNANNKRSSFCFMGRVLEKKKTVNGIISKLSTKATREHSPMKMRCQDKNSFEKSISVSKKK